MRKQRDVEHRVGACDQTEAIVEGITDSVHGMREEGEDSVEGQVGLDEEEEVSPV